MSSLARRYTRWVRFYPPGPRRAELLGTLLECAPPERTRPTAREVGNLARHGLRARLGRPKSTGVVVLATLVTLVCGLFGAAAATRVGWEFAPSLPAGAESTALAATVFPGQQVWGGGDTRLFDMYIIADGTSQYGSVDYWVKHTAQTRDVHTYARGARDRLAAAGWLIQDGAADGESVEFSATRGGLFLTYSAYYQPDRPWYDSDGVTSFELSRASAPSWLPWVAVAGGGLAAATGWLIFGWASRRSEGAMLRTGFGAALTGLTLVVAALCAQLASGYYPPSPRPEDEAFWAMLWNLHDEWSLVVLLPALAAVTAAALPGRRQVAVWATLTVVMVGAASNVPIWLRGSCTPSGPPPNPSAEDAAGSNLARVFVHQDSTDEQRNLAEAAINRVWGAGASSFHYDPTSAEYRYAYCDGRRLAGESGNRMPYFWEVAVSGPNRLPALVAEVEHLPGVAAVRLGRPYWTFT
ncbi:hypothetical protein QLQ12_27930 [Actinoplanes sp. NEAU-A12]|uniref:DUF2207 domain-containing protein n=1 Tax=Actinoplanes sandaracinus TaxID=3045177 RepID=A0ABT6WS52_9ACTN|nr:hypothetical protein [Actinoplanes sandaracinus]MDI6102455.1 hypothetical protein [Actinoplanes sandaracinus]